LGWRTTTATKPLAIDELSASIRDSELGLFDSRTIAELRTFVRDPNGKMHGSPHDDRVMSLAITYQMLKYVWLPEYRAEAPIPKYSLHWFERFIMSEDHGTDPIPIGAYNTRRTM
jgi:hypothetical protein